MSAHNNRDRGLHYLEMLDDEYRALEGQAPPSSPLRREFAEASRHVRELPEDAPVERRAEAEVALATAESAFRAEVMKRLAEAKRSALCFSGGGIRSATFGLGILQGLAVSSNVTDEGPRLLGEFDYLSTVSGGGYLGAWFSAWAARYGTAAVISELAKSPDAGFDPEPDPVKHLRAYSNYLTPKLGLFSGDTWAAAGSIVRNMFLNWLVLLPVFAAALLIPLFAWNCASADVSAIPDGLRWYLLGCGFFFGALATGYIGYDLPSLGNARSTPLRHAAYCLGPLMLAAVCLTTFWAWLEPGDPAAPWWNLVARGRAGIGTWDFSLFGAAMHAGGMLVGIALAMAVRNRPAPKIWGYATAMAFITGMIAGPAMRVIASSDGPRGDGRLYACMAFPAVMGVFLLGGTLLVGLTSYITDDKDREWWGRSGGIVLGIALAWPLFASLVLYAPDAVQWIGLQVSAALTAVTGWGAAKLGGSDRTPSGQGVSSIDVSKLSGTPWIQQAASRLILPAFLVFMTFLLSIANNAIVDAWGPYLPHPRLALAVLFGAYLALCLVASAFINVNVFSLHAMYRQRLIRAYLGASNPHRDPHWFTGFDEHDNIPMSSLEPFSPLHVVNMTLNLVSGKNLAWQQRKAEPFTSTRLHTGSSRLVYRPSWQYGGQPKLKKTRLPFTLGTATTISGAAASPNMGYNSSPMLALVMTLFNARLGWWSGNPADASDVWKQPGPTWGFLPFLYEALGLTDDTRAWVYLSDGGHFENLGLYEMVFRRCRSIVVCDAGEDPEYTYEDLGNAVRKIRVDLGIPIEFPERMPMSPARKPTADYDGRHCAIGQIRYSAIDGTAVEDDGVLIYIKASLSGDEPADVLHYASKDPRFPHQPTPDQFFDEAQFESYRRLGLHIVEKIVEKQGRTGKLDLREFIASAREYAAVTHSTGGAIQVAQSVAAGQSIS